MSGRGGEGGERLRDWWDAQPPASSSFHYMSICNRRVLGSYTSTCLISNTNVSPTFVFRTISCTS